MNRAISMEPTTPLVSGRRWEAELGRLADQLTSATVVRFDEPMGKRTTLRVGGKASCYIEPGSEDDLVRVVRCCRHAEIPFFVMGRGSNLLVRDGGFSGVVVALNQSPFTSLEVDGDRLFCGAGVRLKAVAMRARREGLSGLEFLEGIPGTIGGGLRMNAGAMGTELFERVDSFRYLDRFGKILEPSGEETAVEYRCCPVLKEAVALSAVLRGTRSSSEAVSERLEKYCQLRKASQPTAASAGCAFKNPPGGSAGRLVDELGLKGTRIGGAVISERHGNFIVNVGGATAADVLALIEYVQQRVLEAKGLELRTEVEIIGDPL